MKKIVLFTAGLLAMALMGFGFDAQAQGKTAQPATAKTADTATQTKGETPQPIHLLIRLPLSQLLL